MKFVSCEGGYMKLASDNIQKMNIYSLVSTNIIQNFLNIFTRFTSKKIDRLTLSAALFDSIIVP